MGAVAVKSPAVTRMLLQVAFKLLMGIVALPSGLKLLCVPLWPHVGKAIKTVSDGAVGQMGQGVGQVGQVGVVP